jgi:hypothetical protein
MVMLVLLLLLLLLPILLLAVDGGCHDRSKIESSAILNFHYLLALCALWQWFRYLL